MFSKKNNYNSCQPHIFPFFPRGQYSTSFNGVVDPPISHGTKQGLLALGLPSWNLLKGLLAGSPHCRPPHTDRLLHQRRHWFQLPTHLFKFLQVSFLKKILNFLWPGAIRWIKSQWYPWFMEPGEPTVSSLAWRTPGVKMLLEPQPCRLCSVTKADTSITPVMCMFWSGPFFSPAHCWEEVLQSPPWVPEDSTNIHLSFYFSIIWIASGSVLVTGVAGALFFWQSC